MSRGFIPFSGSFNRRIAEPLDDYRVETKADLLLASSWTAGDNGVYTFLGMFAIVYADSTNNGGYILIAADYTVAGNWLKVGSSVDLSDYVKNTDLFRNGRIKAELLPEITSDVVELLVLASILEDVQGMVSGDKVFYTDDKKIYTYSGTAWENPTTPEADKLYLCKADTLTYKWNGTTLVTTTSPLPYATLGQAIAGTNTSNLITPYSALYAFKNWIINTVHNGFTTASKTIQGAINELKTAVGDKVDKVTGKGLSTNDLTDLLKAAYDAAVVAAHSHSNKSVLDAIEQAFTSALKTAYDNAVTASHAHSNKAVLDAIQESFTTTLKTLYTREIIPLVCSDEVSDLTASASVAKIRFVMPASFTLTDLFAELNTAPTGSSMTIDIKKNGVSIFSTLMTIDASELTSRTAATPHVLTGAISFVLGDYVEVFITVVGSTVAGKGLKLYLLTTKS